MYKAWHTDEYEDLIDTHSPEWQDLCNRRFLVDDGRCPYCGVPAFATARGRLAVHHIEYEDDLLDINSCISICDKCHGILHGWILPRSKDIDPRSADVQEKVRKYREWTKRLIAGEVWRKEEDCLIEGNCGPDVYKQYAGKGDQNF